MVTVEEARNLALKVLDLAIYEGQLRAVVGHATYDRLIDHAKSLLTESPLKPLPAECANEMQWRIRAYARVWALRKTMRPEDVEVVVRYILAEIALQ